jgi:hypothetical protein
MVEIAAIENRTGGRLNSAVNCAGINIRNPTLVNDQDAYRQLCANIPLGRFGEPHESSPRACFWRRQLRFR